MNPPSFDEAVHIAKCILAPQGIIPEGSPNTALSDLAAKRAAGCNTTTKDGYLEFRAENYGAEMIQMNPGLLIALARDDYFCFLALCRGAANAVDLGVPLDESIQVWLLGYLRGEWLPPKNPRGRRAEVEHRFKIFSAVQYLVQLDVTASRNEEAKECVSACDAVAKALKELGRTPRSHKRVKDIYAEERKKFPDWEVEVDPATFQQF